MPFWLGSGCDTRVVIELATSPTALLACFASGSPVIISALTVLGQVVPLGVHARMVAPVGEVGLERVTPADGSSDAQSLGSGPA